MYSDRDSFQVVNRHGYFYAKLADVTAVGCKDENLSAGYLRLHVEHSRYNSLMFPQRENRLQMLLHGSCLPIAYLSIKIRARARGKKLFFRR